MVKNPPAMWETWVPSLGWEGIVRTHTYTRTTGFSAFHVFAYTALSLWKAFFPAHSCSSFMNQLQNSFSSSLKNKTTKLNVPT